MDAALNAIARGGVEGDSVNLILRKARSAWRRANGPLVAAREKREKAHLYTALHSNLDPGVHLIEAAAWLCRAQDFGSDRGVSYGADFGRGFLTSYPETTGYIICTFLDLARHYGSDEYLRRAVEMGEWEASVQMDCGAPANYLNNPVPALFDTGMVLLGWSALYRHTGSEVFARAAARAGEWMVSIQEPSGHWTRGNDHGYAHPTATLYNVKAAWGLAEAGRVFGNSGFIAAAVRNAEYTLTRQLSNGWFEECCLTDPKRPLLHTIAYTMQGLMGIGKLTGREDFIRAAALTADSLKRLMDPHGYIPGRINRRLNGVVDWSCLTGTAQTSIVWSELAALMGNRDYLDAADLANRYLMARHDISSSDSSIRGGLAGSWPVRGNTGDIRSSIGRSNSSWTRCSPALRRPILRQCRAGETSGL